MSKTVNSNFSGLAVRFFVQVSCYTYGAVPIRLPHSILRKIRTFFTIAVDIFRN